MPDLGPYAVEVGLAYAGSMLLLAVIVVQSVLRARRATRDLAQIEPRKEAQDGD